MGCGLWRGIGGKILPLLFDPAPLLSTFSVMNNNRSSIVRVSFIVILLLDLSCGWAREQVNDHELNRFWRHIQHEQAGLDNVNGKDCFHEMKQCLTNASNHTYRNMHRHATPTIVDTLNDNYNRTVLVEIKNAISPQQVRSVRQLATCTRQYFSKERFRHRGFEGGGGNDCTFLNTLLQIFLLGVYENMIRITELAYDTAGWGSQLRLRPPRSCGVRTSEFLNYDKFKGLGGHDDGGSIYTTIFALSNSQLYEGGEFYIGPPPSIAQCENDENDSWYDSLHYYKPRQYSALVFLSRTYHGVTDITSGTREMFTNELWMYDDAPWFKERPFNSAMDIFTSRFDARRAQHDMDDIEKLWPPGNEAEAEGKLLPYYSISTM